jgi:hypothetical protein
MYISYAHRQYQRQPTHNPIRRFWEETNSNELKLHIL